MKHPKILVTGATGRTGRAVVEDALRGGERAEGPGGLGLRADV